MPRICYVAKEFAGRTLDIIEQANDILDEYAAQGFDLTLRQLYYQFVSRGLLDNVQRQYKRLGSIISSARLAGLVDWSRIVDRTRELKEEPHWRDPEAILEVCAKQFRLDRWLRQPVWPEVWIEKDALMGVIGGVCAHLDVRHFSCRGYTSQSEMWVAARRLCDRAAAGQTPVILHFGDHDPSGIDMTRDIADRMRVFGLDLEVRRLALNMAQVDEYGPPPNPAKVTDSRYGGYVLAYGEESWELDALEPSVLAGLIETAIESLRDDELWEKDESEEEGHKAALREAAGRWGEVTELLEV